jgi:hypothetical protein
LGPVTPVPEDEKPYYGKRITLVARHEYDKARVSYCRCADLPSPCRITGCSIQGNVSGYCCAGFARIGDPGAELKKALESNFHLPVVVTGADGSRSQFYVRGFATREVHDGVTIMKTPALSFKEAEAVLKQYWFAPFISPDFSPGVTRVVFPDRYAETFYEQDQIPGISHVLS